MTGMLLNPSRFSSTIWTPASLPNLALWLDASDTATITNVSGVASQWNDKSGNGNNATSASGVRPTIGTDSTSGLGKLSFTSQNMTVATASSLTTPTGGVTLMIACNITSWSSFGILAIKDNSSFSAPGWDIFNNSGTTQAAVQTSGGRKQANYTSVPTGRMRIGFRCGTTSNNLISRRNGATVNTTASTGTYSTTSASILLMGDAAGAGAVTGELFEVVLCMNDISDTDLGLLESYFATKWSVS